MGIWRRLRSRDKCRLRRVRLRSVPAWPLPEEAGFYAGYRRGKASLWFGEQEEAHQRTTPERNHSRRLCVAKAAGQSRLVVRRSFTNKLYPAVLRRRREDHSRRSRAEEEGRARAAPRMGLKAEPEEMYNQIAAWYNAPENAALRATWGAYPGAFNFGGGRFATRSRSADPRPLFHSH